MVIKALGWLGKHDQLVAVSTMGWYMMYGPLNRPQIIQGPCMVKYGSYSVIIPCVKTWAGGGKGQAPTSVLVYRGGICDII